MPAENPYQAPHERHSHDDLSSSIGVMKACSSFAIGKHEVSIKMFNWTGLESYSVDGQERLRIRNFGISGARRFTIAPDSAQQIEIRYRIFPIWSAQAFLNGVLVVEELFPRLRMLFRTLSIVLAIELVVSLWLTYYVYFR